MPLSSPPTVSFPGQSAIIQAASFDFSSFFAFATFDDVWEKFSGRTWTTNHSKWKIVVCVVYAPGLTEVSSSLPSLPLLCLLLLLLDSRAPRKLLFSSYFAQRFLLFFLCSGIFRLRFRAVPLPPCLSVSLSVLPVPGHRLGSVLGPLSVPGSLFVLSAADLARICWQRLLCLGLPPVDDVWDFLAIFIYLKMKRRTHKVKQGGGEKRRRDHSCKGGFNVALICGNRALNVAIFEVKLLELFDAMRCETSR